MNRTTTVVVALIAAAGLSTMVYAVPEQRALAWGGGFGGFGGFGGCGFGFGGCGEGFFGDGCGFGCGGGFFGDGFHKHIIQTASQVNTCHGNGEETGSTDPGQHSVTPTNGGGEKCVNTGVNTSGNLFGGLGLGQGLDGTNH